MTLYLDCFSGISGDMFLGALLDLGADKAQFLSELKKIPIDEFTMDIHTVAKNGIAATKVDVKEHHHHHEHHHGRNLADITAIINKSSLSEKIKNNARCIFENLAKAEAKVHNTTPMQIHFHEVGAVDAIVDIIGACILIEQLSITKIIYNKLFDGQGFVHCAHGLIPVPVPAVFELTRINGVHISICDEEGEMITPTGMAILTTLGVQTGNLDGLKTKKIGYGAGTKDFKRPNLLRAVLLEESEETDIAVLLECNIDDQTGEYLGYASQIILENGAKDVFFTPVFTKKNRPAYMLSVLCSQNETEKFENLIFQHTTTLGIRKRACERVTLPRTFTKVNTKFGEISVKVSEHNGIKRIHPEFSDIEKIAKENHISLAEVLNEI